MRLEYCKNCVYYTDCFCANGASEYAGEFMGEYEWCSEWESEVQSETD